MIVDLHENCCIVPQNRRITIMVRPTKKKAAPKKKVVAKKKATPKKKVVKKAAAKKTLRKVTPKKKVTKKKAAPKKKVVKKAVVRKKATVTKKAIPKKKAITKKVTKKATPKKKVVKKAVVKRNVRSAPVKPTVPVEIVEDIAEKKVVVKKAVVKKKKKVNYLNNKDLMAQVQISRENDQMSDRLAHMLQTLAARYGRKGNWANYTYNEDMQAYAMMMLVRTWRSFDPKKSNNPFAFFTQCIKNSFIQFLNQERRQRDIRDVMLVDKGMSPSYNFQMEYEAEQKKLHEVDPNDQPFEEHLATDTDTDEDLIKF
jgi:DNA-directed RNA polymerase specialized sigma24 family protein